MSAATLDFLAWAVPLAQAEARRTGIPVHLTLAQGIIESASGTSILATGGHNYFGIKGDYLGKFIIKNTGEVRNGQAVREDAAFRAYPDRVTGFRDHSNFLRRSHYSKVWFQTVPVKSTFEVADAGYATALDYQQTLLAKILEYNLTQYDVPMEVPMIEPLSINRGVVQGDNIEGIPFSAQIIVSMGLLNVRTKRKLTSLDGITIHDTANTKAGADAEMHARWLKNIENSDSQDISIHFFVDQDSITQCIPVDEVAFHAGSKTGNATTVSIEICENSGADRARAEKNAQVLAAALLRTYPGLMVFKHQDWSGKYCPNVILRRGGWDAFKAGIYDLLDTAPETKAPSYPVKITATKLNIRKSPSRLSGVAGTVSKGSIYTIVETAGNWGKLKSGAGWISLKHVTRV
jgi:hypothetical protein